MPGLSIGCEVRGCSFTTPELDSSFYPSMVSQLQIHHASLHTEAAEVLATERSLTPTPCRSRSGTLLVDKVLAKVSEVTPEKRRQRKVEEQSISEEKLGSTSKGMRRVRVSLKKPRLDLIFLCTKCNLCSFNTAHGLYQHQYRWCKKEMSSTDMSQKLVDGQNNIDEDKVIEKNPRTTNIQLWSSFERQVECPDCQKSYSTLRGVTLHRRSFCRNRRPGIICFICNETFSTTASLRWHMKKCGKSEQNAKSKDTEDRFPNKDQEHVNTCLPDKESSKTKVMITVEFTSEQYKKSRLRWKVPELTPIHRILERVCDRFSMKTNLLLFTFLGKEVNPGDLASQYGGKVIQAVVRSGEMTMDLDIEQEESEEL